MKKIQPPLLVIGQQQKSKSRCCLTFFSFRSSIGELAMLGVASPNKKHSLVISSWEEREEPSWGSTWRSGAHTHTHTFSVHAYGQANNSVIGRPLNDASCAAACVKCVHRIHRSVRQIPLFRNALTAALQSPGEVAPFEHSAHILHIHLKIE